jgi:hypothetical protein
MIVAMFMPGVAKRGSAVSARMADSEVFDIFYSWEIYVHHQGKSGLKPLLFFSLKSLLAYQ